MKKVYGSYLNEAAAQEAMSNLYEKGYTREDIKMISNKDLDSNLNHTEANRGKDNESMWDKIKETFTPDDDHEKNYDRDLNNEERTALAGYQSNLQAGEVLLLVEERVGDHDDGFNKDLNNDEKVMELKKEKLNVDKEEVKTGEVDVKKVTKEDTQTVDVPVEKEEVVIEKRSALGREVKDGETIGNDSLKGDEEIHIPIKEERVNVTKDTVVDDEVVIRKDKHKKNKTVTEKVKHEDVEVEGDEGIKDELKDKNKKNNKRF